MDNIQISKILSVLVYMDGLIILISCRTELHLEKGDTGWIRLSDISRGASIIVPERYFMGSQLNRR
jgi:hypothetical protein